jgi:hypothetical protein
MAMHLKSKDDYESRMIGSIVGPPSAMAKEKGPKLLSRFGGNQMCLQWTNPQIIWT